MRDGASQNLNAAAAKPSRCHASSFEKIVREHQGMVFSLAYRFLRDSSLAEDLAQEVFLDLYRKAPPVKSPQHLRFWLRKVTAHRCIDYSRRKRIQSVGLEQGPEPAAAPPSNPDHLLSEKLRRLVAALPARRRMVVLLRYEEELELHEIAEVMEMPINTVKSYLQRSLKILRGKLARCRGGVTV